MTIQWNNANYILTAYTKPDQLGEILNETEPLSCAHCSIILLPENEASSSYIVYVLWINERACITWWTRCCRLTKNSKQFARICVSVWFKLLGSMKCAEMTIYNSIYDQDEIWNNTVKGIPHGNAERHASLLIWDWFNA